MRIPRTPGGGSDQWFPRGQPRVHVDPTSLLSFNAPPSAHATECGHGRISPGATTRSLRSPDTRLEPGENVTSTAPGQAHPGPTVAVAVDEQPAVRLPLFVEPDGVSRRPQSDAVLEHLRRREARHDCRAPGHDRAGSAGIGLQVPVAHLGGPPEDDLVTVRQDI